MGSDYVGPLLSAYRTLEGPDPALVTITMIPRVVAVFFANELHPRVDTSP